MEPRVQYAKTSDGVDIAFAVYGEGPPLVVPPNLVNSHVQLEMTERIEFRAFIGRLARRMKIIRYDCRGVGMSQRDQIDFSPEAAMRDLGAVVDRLGLDRFALYTHTLAGEGPIAYAASNPDRVSSLTCWVGESVRILPDVVRRLATVEPLQSEDWELYCDVTSRLMFGWDSPAATPFARMMRAGSSPESRPLAVEATAMTYRGEWPARVHVPTLLCHTSGADGPSRIARRLASSIHGAQVVAIPTTPSIYATGIPAAVFSGSEILTAAIEDFVEATLADPTAPAPELRLGSMRAILWTDIEEHTALMQRFGDAKGRELLREHERITREALSAHGGTEVKAMGDGFMAWFSSVQQAVECAVALQRAFAARNEDAAEPLLVRAGLNAGEPIAEDDDLFGTSVIAAARICREAAGGEIVASDVVRQLVAGKGFHFSDRGEVALKGFDEPVRLFEVRWRS